MTLLYAAKNPCNKCSGPISWDKRIREKLATNLPLNLDGTVHDRESCMIAQEQQHNNPPFGEVQTELTVPSVKEYESKRTDAIARAHEENLDSQEKTRVTLASLNASIRVLTETFHRDIKSLTEAILMQNENKSNNNNNQVEDFNQGEIS